MYEGTPNFPDKDRWWEIVERYGVTILYTAPTAIRTHMKWGPEYAEKPRPVVAAAARLGRRADQPGGVDLVPRAHRRRPHAGRRHVVADRDGDDHDHAAAGRDDAEAGLGDEAVPGRRRRASSTSEGNEVGPGGGGYLVLRKPWPAMLRGIYKRRRALRETYWSKYTDVYFAGDGARIDEDGDFWLLGRVDDVMNVSGHRISTIEVESRARRPPGRRRGGGVRRATDAHDRPGDRRLRDAEGRRGGLAWRSWRSSASTSAKKIGPIAKPANIVFTPELPKTRSGKIMRRLLRDVAENRPLGDTTTLADPAVVEEIRQRAAAGLDRRGIASRHTRRERRP